MSACRFCRKARCTCEAREALLAAAAEINAAYDVVEAARSVILDEVRRSGQLHEETEIALAVALATFDLAVASRASSRLDA